MENKESISYKRVLTLYAGWWAVWMLEHIYLLRTWNWNWDISLSDAIISQLLLAIGGYVMNTSLRYYRPQQKNFVYIVVWSLTMAGMVTLVQRWSLSEIFASQLDYISFLNQSTFMRYLFNWLMISFVTVFSWLWFFVNEQQDNEKRKQAAEQLARDAELVNLRQQLQPHFLFNSLNSITALVGSKPEEARKMVQQLSDFLRGTLKKDDNQLVLLEEEFSHLQLYLDIEKVRFGHRLQTKITHNDSTLKNQLPSLLLQPVVENAIKFGLYDTTGKTCITIDAKSMDDMLILEIKNPFDPTTSSSRQGTGFGLNSVQRRLYLLFLRNDLLSTSQNENIFTTTIKIPQRS
jgi:two-component system LytT family sensor kinase